MNLGRAAIRGWGRWLKQRMVLQRGQYPARILLVWLMAAGLEFRPHQLFFAVEQGWAHWMEMILGG